MFDRVVFNKGVYTVEVVQMEEEKKYVLAVPWLRARGERAPLCATIQYLCEYVRSSTAKPTTTVDHHIDDENYHFRSCRHLTTHKHTRVRRERQRDI